MSNRNAALSAVDRLAEAIPRTHEDLLAQFPRLRGRVEAEAYDSASACAQVLMIVEQLDEAANEIAAENEKRAELLAYIGGRLEGIEAQLRLLGI